MLEKNEKNMKKSPGVEYLKNEKKCNVDITRKPKTSTSANICHVLNFNFLLLVSVYYIIGTKRKMYSKVC